MNLLRRIIRAYGSQIILVLAVVQVTNFTCCIKTCETGNSCLAFIDLTPGVYVVRGRDALGQLHDFHITKDATNCVITQIAAQNFGHGLTCDQIISIALVPAGGGGKNGKIVFQRGLDQDGQIVLLDPVSHSETPLGPGKNPAFSPDGAMIAFEHNDQIFVMNADGSGKRFVVAGQHPSWAPVAGGIAYVGQIDPSTFLGNIFTINIDGSHLEQLTSSGRDDTPTWVAGGKIAFIRIADHAEIFVMKADGSDQHNVTNDPGHDNFAPAWSPDGAKIVFASTRDNEQGEIYEMDADGGNLKRLTNDLFGDEEPSYSPDGAKIVWSSGSRPGAEINKLWIMNADGSNPLILTGTPESAFDTAPDWGVQTSALSSSRKTIARRDTSAQAAHPIRPPTRGPSAKSTR